MSGTVGVRGLASADEPLLRPKLCSKTGLFLFFS